ncbi:MAG: hypothetical protein JXQ96_14015 [Cyclobacteriaceae bacterium]
MPIKKYSDSNRRGFWKNGQEAKAQSLISSLVKHLNPAGGLYYFHETIIELNELKLVAKNKLNESITIITLDRLKKEKNSSISNFELVYHELLKKKKVRRETRILILPLTFETSTRSFDLLDNRYQIVSENWIRNNLGIQNIYKEIKLPRTEVHRYTNKFICTKIEGSGPKEIFKILDYHQQVLRGSIDYVVSTGFWKNINGFIPRSYIPHPNWLISILGDSSIEYNNFISDHSPSKTKLILDRHKQGRLKKTLSMFNTYPGKNSSLQVLLDCIVLFNQGMDAIHKPYAFLSFWQVCETACCSKSFGGKSDEVLKRIKIMGQNYIESMPDFDKTLESFAEIRNQIVHKGFNELEDVEVNILKDFAQHSIGWLIENRTSLPSVGHIEEFYRIKTLSNRQKTTIKEVIDFIDSKNIS